GRRHVAVAHRSVPGVVPADVLRRPRGNVGVDVRPAKAAGEERREVTREEVPCAVEAHGARLHRPADLRSVAQIAGTAGEVRAVVHPAPSEVDPGSEARVEVVGPAKAETLSRSGADARAAFLREV